MREKREYKVLCFEFHSSSGSCFKSYELNHYIPFFLENYVLYNKSNQRTNPDKKYYPTCSNYITNIFKFLGMKKTSNTIFVLSL